MKDSTINNLLDNAKFNTYNGQAFKWDVNVGELNSTNTASYDVLDTHSTITLINNDNYPAQTYMQDISSKLLPDTVYTLSMEITNTAPVEFEVESVGIVNMLTGFPSDGNKITQSFATSSDRKRAYVYFKTSPNYGILDENKMIWLTNSIDALFTFRSTAPSNTIGIYNLVLQKGSVEFFDLIEKSFFNESIKRENDLWKLTNDGITYNRILLEGEVSSLVSSLEFMKDSKDNVYYKININDATISIAPNHIIMNHVNDAGGIWLVGESFVQAYASYIQEHTNNDSNADIDGKHKFTDPATGYGYNLRVINGVIDFVRNTEANGIAVKADRFFDSFGSYHSQNGEHIFYDDTNLIKNKKLILTVTETNGATALTTENLGKTPLVADTDFGDQGSGLVSLFQNSSRVMYHDLEGNHLIQDTLGRKWKLKMNGTTPVFISVPSLITEDLFNAYKLGHDVDGNHIVRDVAKGVYYRLFVYSGAFKLERINYVPLTTYDEVLKSFQKEHDVMGNHVWKDESTGDYLRLQNNLSSTATFDNLGTTSPARDYHHDNIAGLIGTTHQAARTDVGMPVSTYYVGHKIPATFSFNIHNIGGGTTGYYFVSDSSASISTPTISLSNV
jgi:hypothetical protein